MYYIMSKTLVARLEEMKEIYTKLDALGCYNDYDAIREWKALAQDFVRTGSPSEGRIPFPEAKRVLVYRFCNRIGNDTTLELKNIH